MKYLLLLLVACAPTSKVAYRTPCGAYVHEMLTKPGWPEGWTEQAVAEAEHDILAALDLYSKDQRTKNGCSKLNGWHIYPHPDAVWYDQWKRHVMGSTSCQLHNVIVGAGDPRLFAYGHEMVHVLQNCDTPMPRDSGEDDSHSNWVRDGIRDALNATGGNQ